MDFVQEIELQEIINKLRKFYPDFVEAFLTHEGNVYTKKGRLNKSGACRVLDYKPKQLDDILEHCKDIIKEDVLQD